jgi:glc operon protein GlcG
MPHLLSAAAVAGLIFGAATAAQAQSQSLTYAQGVAAMQAVRDYAKNDGSDPSIAVLDKDGNIVLMLRGDNAAPHNLGLARRKAITSNMFKMPSIAWRDRTKTPGTPEATERNTPDAIPLGGGYPITVGGEVVGAVGVSGTRGGQEGDTAAAKAAADAAAAAATGKPVAQN